MAVFRAVCGAVNNAVQSAIKKFCGETTEQKPDFSKSDFKYGDFN